MKDLRRSDGKGIRESELKISTIIPVYNCKDYLLNCMESVLHQTWQNLEVILIDDGSTDGSTQICDYYGKLDSRVVVLHQENKGVSAARNAGMRIAGGDLLSFVDADDTLDADMYEFLVSLMIKENADIAHCGYKHIVGEEVRLIHDTKEAVVQSTGEALSCLVGGRLFAGSLWNKLYRAELLTNLSFREDIRINEDILFNFEAFRRSEKSVFSDFAKYNYIAHKASAACFVTPELKKTADACKVNEYIYRESISTAIESAAADRYLRSLSGYFRLCSGDSGDTRLKGEKKRISEEMWKISKATTGLSKNMKITAALIHYVPFLYGGVYSMYDRIRKPNWEVRK